MRKILIFALIALTAIALSWTGLYAQQTDSPDDYYQRGYQYRDGRHMGPGMMHGRGPHHDRGRGMMMHRNRGDGNYHGNCPNCPYNNRGRGYYDSQSQYQQNPLTEQDARNRVENYLNNRRNPNLKLGDMEEKDGNYEISIVTKDGSLVDTLVIDKETGRMRSIY